MSWVKAASLSGDDVFDENADDFNMLNREWLSNMKKRVRDGYVDGIDAGEDAALEPGFKQGYREGAAQTAVVGHLKGIVSAICCWCQSQHPESLSPASVNVLLQQVSAHEDRILERIKAALENPPPSVSSVSDSMEDLQVQQADSACGGEGCKETGCCSGGGEGCKETGCCSGGGEGCKETGCCSGGGEGCKEAICCRGGEKMDLDVRHQQQKPRSGSTASSSSSSESIDYLLQRCLDIASELGLPQELIGHIQELRNMP